MGTRGLFLLIALCTAQGAFAQTLHEAEAQSELAWQSMPTNPVPSQRPQTPSGESQKPQNTPGAKSPWAAVGYSLLLPGAGHVYAGHSGRAKIFLGAEAVIWSAALIFDRREAWKSDDAVNYAVAHAQLKPEGKDDQFLEALEFYQNRAEYNTAGRVIDPSRPYIPETADTYWQWDDTTSREAYRDLRNSADAAGRNRTFAFYAALLNRVVASVDAFRLVKHQNSSSRNKEGLKVSLESNASLYDPRVMLHAQLAF